MELTNYKEDISLLEIADIKRLGTKEKMKQGTIYLRISACDKSALNLWKIAKENETGKGLAYLIPKDEWDPDYVVEVLNANKEKFLTRYVGQNINIGIDLLKFYKISYHTDLKTQKTIAKALKNICEQQEKIERKIENLKLYKKYSLDNMFAGGRK